MVPHSSPPAGTSRIIILPAVWYTAPPPIRLCFCCLLQTYNIRSLSYHPPAFQLSFPDIHPKCLRIVERIMHWQGMREKYSYACKFLFDLGLSFLPNSQIIQVESSAWFWQLLSSALKPSVMGSRRAKTWRERGGIEHLSEGKKDILIKLVDLSAQEFSFPICWQVSVSQGALRYPACFSRGARKSGLSKMMAQGVR